MNNHLERIKQTEEYKNAPEEIKKFLEETQTNIDELYKTILKNQEQFGVFIKHEDDFDINILENNCE